MGSPVISLSLFANASMSANAMLDYLGPVLTGFLAIGGSVFILMLIIAGVRYATSAGNPEKIISAKKHLKWAVIGMIVMLTATTLVGVMTHAYGSPPEAAKQSLPDLAAIESKDATGFFDVAIKAIIAVFRNIITGIGEPFINALAYFTNSTPLMGQNTNVFNMWLVMVGITNVLLILVVTLLGFHIMSFSTLGFDELDIKQLLPQILFAFVLINSSIFLIDALIGLSNGIIGALRAGFPCTSIWDSLSQIAKDNVGSMGLGGLLVLMAFVIMSIILLVYFVGRLITLYLGAILSPLIVLLWLIPAYRDFATAAAKKYTTVIFTLFVIVVILQLASMIFSDILQGGTNGQPNVLMSLILGLSIIIALLKTQGVMSELMYASSGPRMARSITSTMTRNARTVYRGARSIIGTSRAAIHNGGRNSTATVAGPTITVTPAATPAKTTPLKTGETRPAPTKGEKK